MPVILKDKPDRPNYTRFPNLFLDKYMSELSSAQFKVLSAIVRLTEGFHREKAHASITTIQNMTGLSRQGVLDAAQVLEDPPWNLIKRTAEQGHVTEWELIFKNDQLVNSVDQQNDELVNSVDQTSQLSRPATSGLNKTLKKRDPKDKRSINDKSLMSPGLFNLDDLEDREEEKEQGQKKKREPTIRDRFSKEMQDTFCAETGIPSPDLSTVKKRKAAGELWFSPIWSIYKLFRPDEERQGEVKLVYDEQSLNQAVDLIKDACQQMKDNDLTISFPKSIVAIATARYAEGHFTPANGNVEYDVWAEYKEAVGWDD